MTLALLLTASSGSAADTLVEGFLQALGLSGNQNRPAMMEPAIEQINEFSPVLNRLLNMELHFIQKVANPSPDQLRQLQESGKKQVAELARKMAMQQEIRPDVRNMLTEALAKELEKVGTPEMAKHYRTETEGRVQARKAAAVEQVLCIVDRELQLSEEQAQNISQVLMKEKKPSWGENLQSLMYPEYAPWPNEQLFAELLRPRQKILSQDRSTQGRIHFGWESDLGFSGWINLPEIPAPAIPAAAPQEKKQ